MAAHSSGKNRVREFTIAMVTSSSDLKDVQIKGRGLNRDATAFPSTCLTGDTVLNAGTALTVLIIILVMLSLGNASRSVAQLYTSFGNNPNSD